MSGLNAQLSPLTLPDGTDKPTELVGREKWKANRKAALLKIKSDPILWKKWREEQRVRHAKWKESNQERVKQLAQRYYARLKERAKNDPVAKEMLEKKKNRPRPNRVFSLASKIKMKASAEANYAKLRADPVRYAAMLARGRQWRKKNRDTVRECKRSWERAARNNPAYCVQERLRGRMKMALSMAGTGKCDKTLNLLGCTPARLRDHLESLFLPGMSWDNRSQWHIDHIRPCSSFDLTDPEQQRCCFHFSNLQPLWAADNIKKSDKWQA